MDFTGSDWIGAVVVRLGPIVPHPDPETTTLSITRVMAIDGDPNSGYPVVVKNGEFKEGDLAVYTGIDSIVPTGKPLRNAPGIVPSMRFGFLDLKGKPSRVKARRLRGFYSEGLLTPARPLDIEEEEDFASGKLSFEEGQDLTLYFDIHKYLSDAEMEPAEYEFAFPFEGSYLDLDAFVQLLYRYLRMSKGSGWTWITPERIQQSILAGACEINGKMLTGINRPKNFEESQTTWSVKTGEYEVNVFPSSVKIGMSIAVTQGDMFKIKIFPQPIKATHRGAYLPSSNTEACPFDHKIPGYNLDALRKWGSGVFADGEIVVAREKIHGAQFKAMHDGTRLWVGTHYRWVKRPDDLARDSWWNTAIKYGLDEKLKGFPGYAVFGEMFGQVQDLKYGSTQGEVFLIIFDVYDYANRTFLSEENLRNFVAELKIPMAPLIYEGPWNAATIYEFRNGPSMWPGADHTREGIVVRTRQEKIHPRLGRIVLKLVGEDYKMRPAK